MAQAAEEGLWPSEGPEVHKRSGPNTVESQHQVRNSKRWVQRALGRPEHQIRMTAVSSRHDTETALKRPQGNDATNGTEIGQRDVCNGQLVPKRAPRQHCNGWR
eukprot:4848565-Pyramimonas_sp.AAC.2